MTTQAFNEALHRACDYLNRDRELHARNPHYTIDAGKLLTALEQAKLVVAAPDEAGDAETKGPS